jgi:hypothetical protein
MAKISFDSNYFLRKFWLFNYFLHGSSGSVILLVGDLFAVFRWHLRRGINGEGDEETPRRRALAHEEALAGGSERLCSSSQRQIEPFFARSL